MPFTETENNFTVSLFNSLNRDEIQYAVLRNYAKLPYSTGSSDLDIWINENDKLKFLELLKTIAESNRGLLVSRLEDEVGPRLCFMGIEWGIQIDVHFGVAHHKGVPYMLPEIIKKNIDIQGGIRVLHPRINAVISFLKEILNNKRCKKEYCENAADEINKLSSDEVNSILICFPVLARIRIADVLRSRKFDDKTLYSLGTYCSDELVSIPDRVKYGLKQILKLKRFLIARGYVIGILGTDGSGKSTIINEISPVLNGAFHKGVRYEHLRPNLIPELGVLLGKREKPDVPMVVTDPHARKASGFLGSLFRWGYYLIDYTFGYLFKVYPDKSVKNHAWIFDRYYYDYYLDQKRLRVHLPEWLVKAGEFFVPSPDIILCLGGDPQKIFERKPETDLKEVTRQVNDLKIFCSKHKKAVWVDTCTSREESVRQAMTAICEMMGKRFANQSDK